MGMAQNKALAVVAAFLLAAVWFFFPVGKPEGENLLFALRLALPAIVLVVGGIGLLPCLMTIGFCFCAIGDAMGVIGSFEGQMGGFAVAHICFICQFSKDFRQSRPKTAVLVITSLFCLLPLAIAALRVIPSVQNLPIRIGCVVYALLLIGTVWTSIVRAASYRGRGMSFPLIAALGAILFLVSDFTLSWNKFTARIPHASLYIMITYYAALQFLFIGTLHPRTNCVAATGCKKEKTSQL